MKTKIYLLAIFYRSFGFYLWTIPFISWIALGAPTGRNFYVLIPSLVLYKFFLQGITIYIVISRYSHRFYFYANGNLSQKQLFLTAFLTDFLLFFITVSIIHFAGVWIK
jgi:hypothetical protein